MAECFVSGAGGVRIRTGVMTFSNEQSKMVDLEGVPQMVAASCTTFNVGAINVCLKQPNRSTLMLGNNGGRVGSLTSTSTGIVMSFETNYTGEVRYFAIM